MDKHKLLKEIAIRIARESLAFQCHNDNKEDMYEEVGNFMFEFIFMASFSGTPGYALEKAFNLELASRLVKFAIYRLERETLMSLLNYMAQGASVMHSRGPRRHLLCMFYLAS